jgi:hypothetical protein
MPGAERSYALSWQSVLIEPCIVESPCSEGIYVGVDEHLACVSSGGAITLSIDLHSTLLNIEPTDTNVLIVCELQLLVLSGTGTLINTVDFPDVVDHYTLCDSRLALSCMDGTSMELRV